MVKHLLAIKLMPDKSLIHMPPPPQSNACGQVTTDATDATDGSISRSITCLSVS